VTPFYRQFVEWQQQTLRFYPEGTSFNVRRHVPIFDCAFRKANSPSRRPMSLRWDVAL
jgi:hypothetical protein